jgi:hypothetical protein
MGTWGRGKRSMFNGQLSFKVRAFARAFEHKENKPREARTLNDK